MTNFFKTKFSRRVFNLITDNMTNEEKYSAVSLQGVVAQTSACISLDIPEDFRKYTEEKYGVVFIDIYNIWEVANFFKERINGIIIYDGIEDVNKACTAAAAYGCWALDSKLAEKAVKLGFDIKLNKAKPKQIKDLADFCHDTFNRNNKNCQSLYRAFPAYQYEPCVCGFMAAGSDFFCSAFILGNCGLRFDGCFGRKTNFG